MTAEWLNSWPNHSVQVFNGLTVCLTVQTVHVPYLRFNGRSDHYVGQTDR